MLTDQFARELDRSLSELNRRTRRIILALEQVDGHLVSSEANLGRALQIRSELRQAFTAAGYTDLATAAVDEPLDRLTREVLRGRSIANQAARLTTGQVNTLVAFKDIRLAELLELSEDAIDVMQRATLDATLGSRPTADLLDDLESMIRGERLKRAAQGRRPARISVAQEARTIYDTAVSTYGRQVNQLGTSGEPDELFLYAGPADGAVRPFCRQWVGKVLSRAQISELSNGQLLNVLLTGGGYNCRHTWSPVSELDAELEDLATSGGRLPSIETELQEAA